MLPVAKSAPPSTAPKRTLRAPARPSPVVKWVGGKTKLLSHLTAKTPSTFRKYYEPFVGGGALYFQLLPKKAILSDQNKDLIHMYETLRDNVEGIIRKLTQFRNAHDKDHYYDLRKRWNGEGKKLSSVGRAAAFIYFNKTCYNGLWRVNRSGGFNVPIGRYSSPSIFSPSHLRLVSKTLQHTVFKVSHFAKAVTGARAGDLVYFDPPYWPASSTSNFTSYTSGSFGAEEQRQLAAVATSLASRGVHVILSNSDTPFIRELYKGFSMDRVLCTRAINSNAAKRGSVGELIITAV